ncbi:MAG: hypothetical protein ABIX01_09560 [Chitinophagaceae bacterium]
MIIALACKVCSNINENTFHTVRQMQLGLREDFGYQQCARCGSMQLQDMPADISRYYPGDQDITTGCTFPMCNWQIRCWTRTADFEEVAGITK